MVAHTASGCFWVTGTTYEGKPVRVSGLGAAPRLRAYLRMDPRGNGLEMEAHLRNSTNYNDRSDYAVSLAYLGRNQEAVEILEKLEEEQPGNYFVAANLGTALELMGRDDEALHWITEGIRRNASAHHGTEWLHARIIEAKIAQKQNPNFFQTHTVLDLDPKHIPEGVNIGGKMFTQKQIADAIQDQLQERLQFVKPPDQAVASLLFDYSAIEAATHTLESAKGLLSMAVQYGYPSARVESQTKLYDQKIAWRKTKQYLMYSLLGILGMGALIFLYQAKHSRNLRQKGSGKLN